MKSPGPVNSDVASFHKLVAEALTRQSVWRPKRTVLLVSALFSAALGPLIVLANEATLQFRVIRWASILCISLLVLAWCYFDSLEQRQTFHAWVRIAVLFFGMFALFVYLFQSRGLKQGIRSSGMALISLLGLFTILLASAFVCAMAFGLD